MEAWKLIVAGAARWMCNEGEAQNRQRSGLSTREKRQEMTTFNGKCKYTCDDKREHDAVSQASSAGLNVC